MATAPLLGREYSHAQTTCQVAAFDAPASFHV
jgi:hypothetical protein